MNKPFRTADFCIRYIRFALIIEFTTDKKSRLLSKEKGIRDFRQVGVFSTPPGLNRVNWAAC
jgi:hypothetical protein